MNFIVDGIVKAMARSLIVIVGVTLIAGGLIGTVIGYFFVKW